MIGGHCVGWMTVFVVEIFKGLKIRPAIRQVVQFEPRRFFWVDF